MDLNHLRSFVTVAKFAHLTRAAEALHLSQPAISGHIKVLEEQLGVSLFDRTPSGMELTPSGRHLLTEAEQIIEAVQHMQHSAQELRGQPTGRIRLGTVLEPALLRVGELLLGTRERYPQIELELHHGMSSNALANVRNGTLDASFYFGTEPEGDLRSVALRDVEYVVVLPMPLADELRDASWDALAGQPWVVAPEPSTHRHLVLELFGGKSLPERVIVADNESVIINLVESGVGIGLIRDEMAAQLVAGGRGVIWAGRSVTTRLWLVYPASHNTDPLLSALREVLGEVWSDASAAAPPAA